MARDSVADYTLLAACGGPNMFMLVALYPSYLALAATVGVAYIAVLAGIALRERSMYGKRVIVCPETNKECEIELDRAFTLRSMMFGRRELKIKSCDRWPEKEGCGEECLVQVEPTPQILSRIFAQWYAGKCCTRCSAILSEHDWDRGHVAVLSQGTLVELHEIPLEKLPQALTGCLPLCRECHFQELNRRMFPEELLDANGAAEGRVPTQRIH